VNAADDRCVAQVCDALATAVVVLQFPIGETDICIDGVVGSCEAHLDGLKDLAFAAGVTRMRVYDVGDGHTVASEVAGCRERGMVSLTLDPARGLLPSSEDERESLDERQVAR